MVVNHPGNKWIPGIGWDGKDWDWMKTVEGMDKMEVGDRIVTFVNQHREDGSELAMLASHLGHRKPENLIRRIGINRSVAIIAEEVDWPPRGKQNCGATRVVAVKALGFATAENAMLLEDIGYPTGGKSDFEETGKENWRRCLEFLWLQRKSTSDKDNHNHRERCRQESWHPWRAAQIRTNWNNNFRLRQGKNCRSVFAKLSGGVAISHRLPLQRFRRRKTAWRCIAWKPVPPYRKVLFRRWCCTSAADRSTENVATDNDDQATGVNIVRLALGKPVKNNRWERRPGRFCDRKQSSRWQERFPVTTQAWNKFENFFAAGIIDPTKVSRLALRMRRQSQDCCWLPKQLFWIFRKKAWACKCHTVAAWAEWCNSR